MEEYCTEDKNQFSEDDREFVFICDQTHLVKTGRIRIKCWMIQNVGYNYVLKLPPNIQISKPLLVMNVCLAAQVLSTSISVALKVYGQPLTAGTANYWEMFDQFFDCMNVRNTE